MCTTDSPIAQVYEEIAGLQLAAGLLEKCTEKKERKETVELMLLMLQRLTVLVDDELAALTEDEIQS